MDGGGTPDVDMDTSCEDAGGDGDGDDFEMMEDATRVAVMVTLEAAAEAEVLKARGNAEFKAGHFMEAEALYGAAIRANPRVAALYGNRAAAAMKVEEFGLAISDAKEAIKLDPSYIKGYYRLGSAYMCLGRLKRARGIFAKVVKTFPGDKDAALKLKVCDKELRRAAFEAAIAVEHRSPIWVTYALDKIVVEDTYSGPRLGGDSVVTRAFIDECIEWWRGGHVVHRRYVMAALVALRRLFEVLPSLVRVDVPETTPSGAPGGINVCGDTHGQWYDLLNIFAINGFPSADNVYVFNGDFVDRGSWSVETVMTLFLFKLWDPTCIHLTRGNHETRNMNKMFGFDGEVLHKYDANVLAFFTGVFNVLPLALVLASKVFVCHGGLFSEDGVTLDGICTVNRDREPPEAGIMSDILWADPQPFPGRGVSKRGVGCSFGPDVTHAFLEENGLQLLIRSHEVRPEGYEVEHGGVCITVFSAPNYCDDMGNKGAIVKLNARMEPTFVTYEAVPHPSLRPMQYAAGLFPGMMM